MLLLVAGMNCAKPQRLTVVVGLANTPSCFVLTVHGDNDYLPNLAVNYRE